MSRSKAKRPSNGEHLHRQLLHRALPWVEPMRAVTGRDHYAFDPETKLPFVTLKRAWQTARSEARLGDLRHS